MDILIIIPSSLFLGMLATACMLGMFRRTTVRLLESLRFFPRGALTVEKRQGVGGSGHLRYSWTYIVKTPGGGESFENGKVFGCLLLVCEGVCLVMGVALIIVLRATAGG